MNYSWSQTVFPIAALFSFRMLGLFLLIPVFTIYAGQYEGATPKLIGIALGIYGLSQGILQMPLGFLSDKWGRKSIISIGLILFALGSFIGALTHSIYGMIIARTLQGTGAIGSVLIALLSDLTLEKTRTRAMAVIGMTIGLSFSLAMILGPAIAHRFGLSGIFFLTACFALIGLIILHTIIPTPQKEHTPSTKEATTSLFKIVLTNPELIRLNFGIFCQHFVLTATFFVLPLILKQQSEQGHLAQTWLFYCTIMLLAFAAMIPIIIISERKYVFKGVFIGSIAITSIVQCLLPFMHSNWINLCILVFIYFTAFNILEALLPSQISKKAPSNSKGTAMGVYSTSQFLGIFAGGSSAGFLYQWNSDQAVLLTNAVLCIAWFFCALFMHGTKK